MKKLKLLSKISIVMSLLLAVLGIWHIVDGGDLMGFILIGLAFASSINDWINVFKKES
jgi:hypothetical protein